MVQNKLINTLVSLKRKMSQGNHKGLIMICQRSEYSRQVIPSTQSAGGHSDDRCDLWRDLCRCALARSVGLQTQKPQQSYCRWLSGPGQFCIRYLWFTGSIHAIWPGPVPFQTSNAGSPRAVTQNPVSGSIAKSQGSGKQKAVSSIPLRLSPRSSRDTYVKFCDSDGGTDR